MNFSEWTGAQWTGFGIGVTALLTIIGWVIISARARLERIKQARPHITFSNARFCRPGEHPRPRDYAVYLELVNHGPGIAAPIWIRFQDSRTEVLSEMSRIPHLAVGEATSDFLGFFQGDWSDATEEQSRAIFMRGRSSALCWDRDGRQYVCDSRGTNRKWRKLSEAQLMAAVRDGFGRITDEHLAAGIGEPPEALAWYRSPIAFVAVGIVLVLALVVVFLR